MMRTRNYFMMAAFGCMLLSGCHDSKKPEGEPTESKAPSGQPADQLSITTKAQAEQNITLAPVEAGNTLAGYQAKGKIALPDNASWHIGAIAQGRAEQVLVNVGDPVRKGQILAWLDSDEVRQARAAFANAIAERSRVQAAHALAETNLARSNRLLALKAESISQNEAAKQEVVNAQSATQQAENIVTRERLHLSEILGVAPDRIDATSMQDNMPLRAPGSGRVLQKNITPGSVILPSTDAFVIGDLSHLWMLASVDAAALAKLKVGEAATVTLPDVPSATYDGRITNLGQEFDPTTRMIQVRIAITLPDSRLRPEMLANAEFAIGEAKPALFVPQEAVQQVNGEDVVFVQTAAERFHVQTVQLGEIVNGKVRVLQGLTAGQRVINRGSFIAKSELLKSSIGD